MERKRVDASKTISGTHGMVWWNGEACYEIVSFEAKLKPNRETIQQAEEMGEDTKLMGYSGTWSAKLRKLHSRSADVAEAIKAGKDVRVNLTSKIADPDNGGTERIQLSSCWFDELTLQSFEAGKLVEDDYSGGFKDFNYLDRISDPCLD